MKVIVHLANADPKVFETRGAGERFGSRVTDNGDVIVQHYNLGDPCLVKYTEAAFAKGMWERVETEEAA